MARRKSNIGRYIIHKGISSRCGELLVVDAESNGRFLCHRIQDGDRMVCPDSRCDGNCVICSSNLKLDEIHFMNIHELALYRAEKMIPE